MNKIIYLSLVTVIFLLIGIFIINVISDHPFTQLLDPYILEFVKYILPHKLEAEILVRLLEAEESFMYLWASIPLLLLIIYLTINSKLSLYLIYVDIIFFITEITLHYIK